MRYSLFEVSDVRHEHFVPRRQLVNLPRQLFLLRVQRVAVIEISLLTCCLGALCSCCRYGVPWRRRNRLVQGGLRWSVRHGRLPTRHERAARTGRQRRSAQTSAIGPVSGVGYREHVHTPAKPRRRSGAGTRARRHGMPVVRLAPACRCRAAPVVRVPERNSAQHREARRASGHEHALPRADGDAVHELSQRFAVGEPASHGASWNGMRGRR